MEYVITLKGELWNSFWHVVIGGVIAYVIFPTYSLLVISLAMLGVGALREMLQHLRKKKQPLLIHIIDAIGFLLGGALWYFIRIIFDIKPDLL